VTRKRSIGFFAIGLGLLLALSVSLVAVHGSSHRGGARREGLGNFEETVGALPRGDGKSFRFAVLGDPEEAPAVFRGLMHQAFDLGAAFVLITGDVVDRPTREAYEFFSYQYRALGPAALPTFAAIGNHDICPERLFQEYLGPEEFHFLHRGSLFIFADNNGPEGCTPGARYIRETIARYRGQTEHVFIVLHKPIFDFSRAGGELQNSRENSLELYQILDAEKVDAVLAAHFHGYLREMYKDTLLLVTGGAGSKLHAPDAFFHMVLVDVGPDGIHDRIVRAEAGNSIWDRVSYRLAVKVHPFLFGAPHRALAVLLAAAALVVIGLGAVAPRRSRPAAPAGAPSVAGAGW